MTRVLPYGHQTIEEDDVRAVVDALGSDWLTQGPRVDQFEQALAERCGARHAVAFNSGTAALHAACAAAGIGPGDEVLTPALSFAASANCARYVGADVGFVDVDGTDAGGRGTDVHGRGDGTNARGRAGPLRAGAPSISPVSRPCGQAASP